MVTPVTQNDDSIQRVQVDRRGMGQAPRTLRGWLSRLSLLVLACAGADLFWWFLGVFNVPPHGAMLPPLVDALGIIGALMVWINLRLWEDSP
jgi:hypothetical protein